MAGADVLLRPMSGRDAVPGTLSRQGQPAAMDVVTLFAIVVFSGSWYFYARTDGTEVVIRLFFGTMMFMAAAVGVLGWLQRQMS